MAESQEGRRLLGPEALVAIFDHTADGVLFTIPDGTVLAANPSACALLGLTEEQICAAGRVGIADSSDPRWVLGVEKRSQTGQAMGEARMLRGDGRVFEAEMTSATFTTASGEPRACVIFRDISERLATQDLLREAALVDELTGLLNRRGFTALANHEISAADRDRTSLDLLYLDVDEFKVINDRHGHTAGDRELKEIARLLRVVCRSSDVVGRLGGDEFVVLLRNVLPAQVAGLVARISSRLADVQADAGHAPVTVSIGVSGHQPGQTLTHLIADADRAMYAEKQRHSSARAALRAGQRAGVPGLGVGVTGPQPAGHIVAGLSETPGRGRPLSPRPLHTRPGPGLPKGTHRHTEKGR